MTATYDPIATTTLGSAASTITFSSIPNTFTDLRLVLFGVTLNATGTYNQIRFNNDTGTNYSWTQLLGNGSAAQSSRGTSTATLYLNDTDTSGANPYLQTVDLFSYAGSTNKTILSETSMDRNGGGIVGRVVGLWRNTTAINRIDLVVNAGNQYQAGTTATLYGIKSE